MDNSLFRAVQYKALLRAIDNAYYTRQINLAQKNKLASNAYIAFRFPTI